MHALYITLSIIFGLNLLFTIHNAVAYLVIKKVGCILVYTLYTFIGIENLVMFVLYIIMATDPMRDPALFFNNHYNDSSNGSVEVFVMIEWVG